MEQIPLILYYMKDMKKERLFRQFCRKQGCRVRALGVGDVDREVGYLAGISPVAAVRDHEKAPEGLPVPEVLIFSGLSMDRLEEFLDAYKQAGIPPVGLKAVLTEHNLHWTVYELATELMKERMAMMMNRRDCPVD